ncbi:cyanophycinase [Chitinimonas lacunae]|uniref:Cyanophycinase n=1 Tax=Chitinimonas lacunae TaxID=1963018 RepID=A0ABV8MQJ0_9NEIS
MSRKQKSSSRPGHLVVVGGAEDREQDKPILREFARLSGGEKARIAVLTAASSIQDEIWEIYDKAFGDLGVEQRMPFVINSRDEANDPHRVEQLLGATGIYMTGGDQKRLLAMLGGTALDSALHRAFFEHGTCIGGTSAGASAMSGHMLAESLNDSIPQKGSVNLAAGLGFLHRVVIDQHFSARQRLGRLLAVVAQNPYLFGVGIDEDTALVIEYGKRFEVIGEGAVTVLDGRQMSSNFLTINHHEHLELIDVRLHLFPAGARYEAGEPGDEGCTGLPESLREIVSVITNRDYLS